MSYRWNEVTRRVVEGLPEKISINGYCIIWQFLTLTLLLFIVFCSLSFMYFGRAKVHKAPGTRKKQSFVALFTSCKQHSSVATNLPLQSYLS